MTSGNARLTGNSFLEEEKAPARVQVQICGLADVDFVPASSDALPWIPSLPLLPFALELLSATRE